MNDMKTKRRQAFGPRHGRTHLTDAQVVAARAAVAGGDKVVRVAQLLGVKPTTISMIVTHKNWKHLP